jgi:hypothetical protein
MSDPQRTPHPEEPAEGQDEGGTPDGGRTPHPEEPAEGADVGGGEGADTPS